LGLPSSSAIPARTATADVEWPNETVTDNQGNSSVNPLSKPPDGIEHHYAPLGAFTVTSGKLTLLGNSASGASSTCRKIFNPLDNV
jgi:hypothetical protein